MSEPRPETRESNKSVDTEWIVALGFGLVGVLVASSSSGAAFAKYLPGGALGTALHTDEISAAFAVAVTLPLALALTLFGGLVLRDQRRGHWRSPQEWGFIAIGVLVVTNFAGAAIGYDELKVDWGSIRQIPGTNRDVDGVYSVGPILANLLMGYPALYGWLMFLASVITASLCVYLLHVFTTSRTSAS